MAYEKHEWATGETITADKLNHIEDGFDTVNSASNVLIVGASFTRTSNGMEYTVDTPYNTVVSALRNKKAVIYLISTNMNSTITQITEVKYVSATASVDIVVDGTKYRHKASGIVEDVQ